MKKQQGFTLIEILLLIVVTGILGSTIMLSLNMAAQKTPVLFNYVIAEQTVRQCAEWYLGQRRLNGFNSITCPSTTVPSFCTKPAGYTLAVNVACTTINTDTDYKTITVTVGGAGSASLSVLIADY